METVKINARFASLWESVQHICGYAICHQILKSTVTISCNYCCSERIFIGCGREFSPRSSFEDSLEEHGTVRIVHSLHIIRSVFATRIVRGPAQANKDFFGCETDRQTGRHTDRQTAGRQTDRQADMQVGIN